MCARFGFVTVLTISLFHPSAGLSAEVAWTDIIVRVYNATDFSTFDMHTALRIASATLAAANVEVNWRECPATQTPSPCDTPMVVGELALRTVRSPAGTDDARALTLGDALVDAHASQGVLATLYVDRVQRLASAAGANAPELLGRAIAHELGHLLVATSVHSKHGIMRAVWSRDEVQRSRRGDWEFTKPEVAAIHRRMKAIHTTELWGTR